MNKFKISRHDMNTVIMRLINSKHINLHYLSYLYAFRQAVNNYGNY